METGQLGDCRRSTQAVPDSHRLSYDYMETRLYKRITSSLPLAISMFDSIALLHPTSCFNNNFSKRSAGTVPNGTANLTRIGPSTKKIPFENVSTEHRVSIEFQMKRPSQALPRSKPNYKKNEIMKTYKSLKCKITLLLKVAKLDARFGLDGRMFHDVAPYKGNFCAHQLKNNLKNCIEPENSFFSFLLKIRFPGRSASIWYVYILNIFITFIILHLFLYFSVAEGIRCIKNW